MRFGLGWRTELGASILANLDRIDVVEVMVEDFVDATSAQRRALRFLRHQVPVVAHGTSLGLASTEPVDIKRLEAIAGVLDWLEPELWSEHLAFVRSQGVEIGHLAAPPRNEETLAGLQRNLTRARDITGILPLLENVASLVEPPCSRFDEAFWLQMVADQTGVKILLDLHNIHANAENFHFDAQRVVASLNRASIGAIHLAGGRRIEGNRLLDDHLHEVPEPVFALLASLVSDDDFPVIIERDGNYPSFEILLNEVERARSVCQPTCSIF